MPARALLLLLLLACGSCSSPGESSSATARKAINTVGTPVYAVGKGIWCAVSAVAGVPVASVAQVSGIPQEGEIRRDVYRTVGKACGGSYKLGSE